MGQGKRSSFSVGRALGMVFSWLMSIPIGFLGAILLALWLSSDQEAEEA